MHSLQIIYNCITVFYIDLLFATKQENKILTDLSIFFHYVVQYY